MVYSTESSLKTLTTDKVTLTIDVAQYYERLLTV